MRNLSGNQIREEFLRFFESKQHRRVHSSSLVPANDPTLLFTNAGMNQFKDLFLGNEQRAYSRAATSQKCVRAGGKHNDLENVGFTRRHHTFFEMLGNFSFGDYFKKDAISFAWELLTDPAWFAIDKSRLYVTIFEGTPDVPRDDEAEQFWIAIGVPKDRIFEMSAKDNFWQMGETGPCGPCSEIFFDLGLAASEHTDSNGNPQDVPFPDDAQRYVEIWNLVFMQFDRSVNASGTATLTPLPKPSIDTGMGLERLATVLQGKLSNYESDLFTPLIAAAARLTNFDPSATTSRPLSSFAEGGGSASTAADTPTNAVISTEAPGAPRPASGTWKGTTTTPPTATIATLAVSDDKHAASLRIIADHARASTFLISDGVLPSNEGRGYVLRKILRRGIRHGRLLGQEKPFMHQMVYAVRDEMQAAYPELKESADRVAKVVLAEEQQFARVLDIGSKQLDQVISQRLAVAGGTVGMANPGLSLEQLHQVHVEMRRNQATVPGTETFRLYETFGLPKDFIADAIRDAGLIFDLEGFERAKEEEQARARASWKGGSQKTAAPVYRELPRTEFEGYKATRLDGARIIALVKDGEGVPALAPGETGEVVLDATSFYADSGGQVGDIGWLYGSDHHTVVGEVTGCKKPVQGVFAHQVIAKQAIAVNDTVDTVVNGEVRNAVMRNHTGTHLLHAALRQVLGTHVKQAGSLNDPNRLRFDFSHFTGVAEEELAEIESIVNNQILKNSTVQTFVDVPIDQAIHEYGAMALFGEKYGDKVRVVSIGETPGGFSTELCGGTHVASTGEIGLIKIVSEGAVASGIRRVEAVSGTGALDLFRRDANLAKVAGQFVGGSDLSADTLRARVNAQEEEMKKLRRELDEMRMKSASAATADAAGFAVEVKGIKVLAQRVDALGTSGEAKSQMRNLVDELRGKLGSGVVVLGAAGRSEDGGKVSLIVGVTKDLTGKLQAGKIVGALAAKVGGKGGGRPDLAEAGGTDIGALDATLESAKNLIADLLG